MAFDAQSMEGRERAEYLMRCHERYEAERANWDTLWEQIAERIFPRAQQFTSKSMVQGDLRGEKVFDNTPSLALDRFAAAIGSYLTPDSDQWHGLEVSDPDVNDSEEVKEYLELATDRLFQARYRPGANFSSQMHECYLSLGAFGTDALFIDEAVGAHMRYRAMHLSEIYLGENHQGLIDRVHRGRFVMKAYQVEQLAHHADPMKRWVMPDCVRKALEGPNGGNPQAEFEFIHCVYPNEEWNPQYADYRGMAFRSTYVSVQDRTITNEGGYRTMPYAVGRYVTGPRETYGRSPAMTVFRDILMLNEMNKDVIRAAQAQVDPPYLVSEEGSLSPFSMGNRAINYGYVTEDGKPLAIAMRHEGELAVGLEMIQDRRTAVNDAFLITLFQILVDNPNETATEALLRAQEKGQLLGPALGRQQSEMHGTMIERELDILSMAGQLPPMPDALAEALDNGAGVTVAFKAPINRLQKTDKAVGVLKAWEALSGLAAHDPTVLDVIDVEKGARIVAESAGAPPSALRTPEEIAELREQRQAQTDLEQLVKGAPQVAKAARDLAQAQAVGSNVPPAIPYVQPGAR